MKRFVWSARCRTGVPEMDAEHVVLFSLYNQIIEVMESDDGADALGDILFAITNYIKFHFAHEEQLLQQADYPDFAAHRASHEVIIEQIIHLYDQYLEDGAITAASGLAYLVYSWLTGHVLNEDKAYGKVLAG